MNKKKLTAAVLAAVMMLGLSACGGSGSDEQSDDSAAADNTITFVLDWTPNTNHTGVYVADKLGYFEEAGLDVEIVQPPEDGTEAMVGSGQAQFGVSFQDIMASLLQGEEKAVLAGVCLQLYVFWSSHYLTFITFSLQNYAFSCT